MTSTATAIEFHDVHLPTGVRLRCTDIGPRDGRPILLLHGYSDSWFSFSRILGLTPPDWRLIIPDQRGHGESDRPEGGYTPASFAADAIALLDVLGIASTTIVGHSMGSFIAQHAAVAAPARVDGIVLIGSAARAQSEAVHSLVPAVSSLTDPVDEAFVRDFQMGTIHHPIPPEFLERIVAESLKLPARVWKAVLEDLIEMPVQATAVQCPTAIFWGEHDAIFDARDQDELLGAIPHASLHIFSGVGHCPNWEAPVEFVDRLVGAV